MASLLLLWSGKSAAAVEDHQHAVARPLASGDAVTWRCVATESERMDHAFAIAGTRLASATVVIGNVPGPARRGRATPSRVIVDDDLQRFCR
jgi:hypothetical protein